MSLPSSRAEPRLEQRNLTDPIAIGAYMVVFHHAVHHFRRIYYDDEKSGAVGAHSGSLSASYTGGAADGAGFLRSDNNPTKGAKL